MLEFFPLFSSFQDKLDPDHPLKVTNYFFQCYYKLVHLNIFTTAQIVPAGVCIQVGFWVLVHTLHQTWIQSFFFFFQEVLVPCRGNKYFRATCLNT